MIPTQLTLFFSYQLFCENNFEFFASHLAKVVHFESKIAQLATLRISCHLNYGITYAPFNRFWVSIAKDFLTITYFWRFSILIVLKTELLSSRTNFMMLFKIMFLISSINLDVCSNFRSHSDGVTCLQFNDFYIVSGSYDKTVKLWDFTVC